MTKIMLVEDDNNLREIYEARLLAEGYEIVSANDGEEALALAVKERPDLIISDIMMPKISGFDMLDILRSTAETKDTKVIMMTALSQMEDKERANKLGADRYLVKSQVTLEDVAKAAREVIDGQAQAAHAAAPSSNPTPAGTDTSTPPAASNPVADTTLTATPAPATPIPVVDAAASAQPAVSASGPAVSTDIAAQIDTFVAQTVGGDSAAAATPATPAAAPTPPPATAAPATPPATDTPQPENEPNSISPAGKRIIQPLHDISTGSPDLNSLLAKEQEREAMAAQTINPTTPPQPPATPPAQ